MSFRTLLKMTEMNYRIHCSVHFCHHCTCGEYQRTKTYALGSFRFQILDLRTEYHIYLSIQKKSLNLKDYPVLGT